jgi:hypothetical protein
VPILLKCPKRRKLRKQLLSRKRLTLYEETAYKKIINCTNTLDLRNTEICLCRVRCKWENRIENLRLVGE